MLSENEFGSGAFALNFVRIQMSSVFQVVRTMAPGVPSVPKPAGPLFHLLSSYGGSIQSKVFGRSKVYDQACASFCESGSGSLPVNLAAVSPTESRFANSGSDLTTL